MFTPYPLYGKILGCISKTITAKNIRTKDIQTITSESDSSYLVDCANFTNGYINYDQILLTCESRSIIIIIDKYRLPYGVLTNINLTFSDVFPKMIPQVIPYIV